MALSRKERRKQGKKVKHKVHKVEDAVEVHHHKQKKSSFIGSIYKNHYKKLLLIPILLLLIAIIQISVQTATTGDFISKGVSLKGGITVLISSTEEMDIFELEKQMSNKFKDNDISVRLLTELNQMKGLTVEADITPEDGDTVDVFLLALEEQTGIPKSEFAVEIMGSSLGQSFFKETFKAVLIAFLFMGIVVFLYFKDPIPSLAVILAAFSDMIVTVAVINIMGLKISTAGIAAFLMLIGYSVDTNILLSTRLLKRDGAVMTKIYSAMKTGFMMTLTTVTALCVALFLAQSEVLKQMMIIVLVGLLVDAIMTWIQNAGILRIYLEKKKHK